MWTHLKTSSSAIFNGNNLAEHFGPHSRGNNASRLQLLITTHLWFDCTSFKKIWTESSSVLACYVTPFQLGTGLFKLWTQASRQTLEMGPLSLKITWLQPTHCDHGDRLDALHNKLSRAVLHHYKPRFPLQKQLVPSYQHKQIFRCQICVYYF